jgi:RNA polymerase sigma factor (sigma-70 family)
MVGAPSAEELTDAHLLERFTTRHEEAAFATLVQRYGPMVLGVCRRILHNVHDAEDAFQATFLIFVRKAATIGKREALGCWLHRVALRTALRAKANAANRRMHERQVKNMRQTDFVATVVWNDLRPVLDEEVERLPEKLRVPFVLCYLEGKTYEQAAQQLRCRPGTLSRRLAQARELLRIRLTRRGLALPAGVLGAALSRHAAPAALSAPLAASTIKAALSSAAGNAATAAGVSTHVAALVEGGLRAMFATKLKIATALLLVIGTATLGVGTLTHPALAQRQTEETLLPPEPQPQAVPNPRTENRQLVAAVAERVAPEERKATTITGRVLDGEGKPVAQAQVAVSAWSKKLIGPEWPSHLQRRLAAGQANAEGQFTLNMPAITALHFNAIYVVAHSPGFGLGWQSLNLERPQTAVEIRLAPEQVLHCRLVDLQGQPAANVEVRLKRVWKNSPAGRPRTWYGVNETSPFWPEPMRTDAQGRFLLRGVDRTVRGTIEARDDRFAPHELEFQPDSSSPTGEITLSVAPAQILEGRVTEEGTDKPIAGARLTGAGHAATGSVDPVWVHGQTDAEGRYRLRIEPGNHFGLAIYAPADGPYLGVYRFGQSWPKGKVRHQFDVSLPRGVLVRGRITEAPSGKLVVGATVKFFPTDINNPFFRNDLVQPSFAAADSGPDGLFKIAVLPGPGHLTVTAPTFDYQQQEVKENIHGINAVGSFGDRGYVHNLLELNLPATAQDHRVSVTLHRGATLKGSLVGPDGQPVAEARMVSRYHAANPLSRFFVSRIEHSQPIEDGRFEITGVAPDESNPVFFLDARNQWGAVVPLSGKQAKGEPITVRLQPCGSATVRYVTRNGQPIANLNVGLLLVVTRERTGLTTIFSGGVGPDQIDVAAIDRLHYQKGLRTDAEGRCTFPCLIPGATYRSRSNHGGRDFIVEPGENRQLPDITIRQEESP